MRPFSGWLTWLAELKKKQRGYLVFQSSTFSKYEIFEKKTIEFCRDFSVMFIGCLSLTFAHIIRLAIRTFVKFLKILLVAQCVPPALLSFFFLRTQHSGSFA